MFIYTFAISYGPNVGLLVSILLIAVLKGKNILQTLRDENILCIGQAATLD